MCNGRYVHHDDRRSGIDRHLRSGDSPPTNNRRFTHGRCKTDAIRRSNPLTAR